MGTILTPTQKRALEFHLIIEMKQIELVAAEKKFVLFLKSYKKRYDLINLIIGNTYRT